MKRRKKAGVGEQRMEEGASRGRGKRRSGTTGRTHIQKALTTEGHHSH